jgi:hypothetical protein
MAPPRDMTPKRAARRQQNPGGAGKPCGDPRHSAPPPAGAAGIDGSRSNGQAAAVAAVAMMLPAPPASTGPGVTERVQWRRFDVSE